MSTKSMMMMKPAFPRGGINGIGRYVGQLQRVTLKFCKSRGDSYSVRNFIEHNLLQYAKENPGIVVYLKPRRHRIPVIFAEYLNGEQQWVACNRMKPEEVVKWMELIKTQSKDTLYIRYRKYQHTDFPSIQGPWTPFFNMDPALNLSEFPNISLGSPVRNDPTATEQLIEMFKSQTLQTLQDESKIPRQSAEMQEESETVNQGATQSATPK